VKLFWSAASPYARKVLACAIAREIDKRIELVPTRVQLSEPALIAANPLSKIPCLITGDGTSLFDSRVICEYLDSIEDGTLPMFPRAGRGRWRALKQQAMADGILDAAVLLRRELQNPRDAARDAWNARQKAAISRTLDELEKDPPHEAIDIGSIAVACALGYLDFRFGAEPWRPAHPRLNTWFAAFEKNAPIARTVPREPA
jgi:glutathione S-transferase